MMSLDERFSRLIEEIQRPRFLRNEGLSNEVGYYIFAYDPREELKVREWVAHIRQKFVTGDMGFQVVVYDLYDLIIDKLQEKGYLEKCSEIEKKNGFDRVSKAIGNSMRITSPDSLIIRHIQENTPESAVVFLTGIGKCYPFLRSHTVLNNLHQVLDRVPVILVYPCKDDGQELILFGEIKDDNFYRAFRLFE